MAVVPLKTTTYLTTMNRIRVQRGKVLVDGLQQVLVL